tara:strand:+ start:163 stop:765 length:603 start_codon:yes stop_codon:yes gene_type:complete
MVIPVEKFIIGLGNPGKKYIASRHNIGFMLLEEISEKYQLTFVSKNKLKSLYSEYYSNNNFYRLFMPTTYMNNSGEAIRAILDWYKLEPDQLIIIVDDIDIPMGRIRCREKGGSGGHNGLKSIIKQLGTENFLRIRIGIGKPPHLEKNKNLNTISHVLGNLSNEEKLILKKINAKIVDSLENLNTYNIEKFICELNSFKT